MDQNTLSYFVSGSAYLFLKMFGNTAVQGYARFRYKSHKYQEDSRLFRAPADRETPQPEILTRADAAWRNDLENIPIFIVAALCGLMTGLPAPLYGALVFAFCAGRTVQTVALLAALQPWRFLGYATGVVTTGLMFALSLRQLGW
jgi:uncharacterized MAPEG superfamily protein